TSSWRCPRNNNYRRKVCWRLNIAPRPYSLLTSRKRKCKERRSSRTSQALEPLIRRSSRIIVEVKHMTDLNVVDQFMQTFIHYIDSGFGLLSGDVGWLSTFLIALDITLAGLFWAMDGEAHVFYRLVKKVLYVGFFALLINNFQSL